MVVLLTVRNKYLTSESSSNFYQNTSRYLTITLLLPSKNHFDIWQEPSCYLPVKLFLSPMNPPVTYQDVSASLPRTLLLPQETLCYLPCRELFRSFPETFLLSARNPLLISQEPSFYFPGATLLFAKNTLVIFEEPSCYPQKTLLL